MTFNPLASLASGVMGGLDSLFTSDDERAKAELLLQKTLQEPHILQAMTNLEEAKHKSVFVAGWRPAIGWIAALGLFYQFLILPFAGLINAYYVMPVPLPVIEAGELMTLVLALLGLGGMRSYEKSKGLTR